MPDQENNRDADPAADSVLSGEAAASALRDVDTAQARARLRARLIPAWYGPLIGVLVAVQGTIGTISADAGDPGWGAWRQWAGWVVLLAVLALTRARRRSTGVMAHKRFGWTGVALVLCLSVTIGLAWLFLRLLGVGEDATHVTLGTALGLVAWAYCAWRNAVTTRQLRELV
ncbi:hypothetical protein [Streptomyces sp. NBC_00203]|uniref:hypothetical protein n=1 Tax=Streptomyces sp. NBC_00203 TaxID=2975680 RepID=UPI0032496A50